MLYYFSGTGNSRLVCELLAEHLGDRCCSMVRPLEGRDGAIGLVFPIYAWGMPDVVQAFIENTLPRLVGDGRKYIYAVMTCGDDIGYADVLLRKALAKGSLSLSAAFSVQMPNTYVCLPGFDVDSVALAGRKLDAMRMAVPEMAGHIVRREEMVSVVRGDGAWLKTYILRPLFNLFLTGDGHFKVTPALCIGCGKCAAHCPVGNIRMSDATHQPQWQGKCAGCLGCYHVCPMKAIQYGRFTKGKGQKK